MNFIPKHEEMMPLEAGDVIEYFGSHERMVRVLVIRTSLEYGLLCLEDSSQYTQKFRDVEEIIKFFTDYEFRIIKSYRIELREV
ncbi:hypothetical protein GMB51_16375 [Turicibacter sanguinis]|uniref:hypothetical protein n=1 Tax=Turicibacter sanguinis TaxID=154288 RepID=UPI0012BCF451|nr:hypothetical protein [Turicibacter sanguinis]MCU7195959.1 hypothetical protein [Turicibacter sanguinis]MTN46607.1 hypothetical protein [Turicibacter sanguinis]MTN52323.1 hypothetical protein [Turicibacter sanguinis]MTN53775.1 hypothetical protein [Turicibacter sanguinis]MTN58617.1 hypothetical protein [Turicibacter sanguinis]